MRLGVIVLLMAALVLPPALLQAQTTPAAPMAPEPQATVVILDGLVGRPLGLAATVVGTATFLATLPFSIPTGDVGRAAQGMIVEPGAWTFTRPMGKDDPKRYESFFFK